MIFALEQILRRPKVVLALMVFMLAAGIYSYITIPKEARPDIQVPVYYVSVPLQGVSPEDSERLLVKPLEEELRSLEGLKEITGISAQGYAAVIAEFNADVDIDKAGRDFREKVDQAKAKLPSDAEEPIVSEVNLSLFPSIVVALSGDVPERALYRHARELQDELETIPSVLEARLTGQREELLEVIIDELKLQSYNLSQRELIEAVSRNNRLIAAGEIDAGQGRFNVKVPGLFETARDIYSLPVKVSNGTVVTLGDVAQVRRTFKDRTQYARFNGRPAITIAVVKRIGENIIDTNAQVREVVKEVASRWPDRIHIDFALDESKIIFEVLGSLQSSIITAIALVMVICVAALGIRSALLVGLAIPTSFMLGFLIVELAGKTINNMLMFGMVLTVGMLVDGAIVITEYADRKMAEGMQRREAYILAARRMFWPVASSTATTLAAFLPMLFWPGVPGKFMSNLPITVIIVLTASLITAMIFLPVLGGYFGKSEQMDSKQLKLLAGSEKGDLRDLPGLTGAYVRVLARLIRYPLTVSLVVVTLLAGIFVTFAEHNNGVTFFVDTEPQQALIYIRGRGNMSIDDKLREVEKVEKIMLETDGVDVVSTQAGTTSGGGRFNGGGLDTPKDLIGQITIELAPFGQRRHGNDILEELRRKTASMPGVIVEVRQREDGPSSGKDIRLQVSGDDSATVNAAARKIRKHMETAMTGLVDIEDETPLPGIEWTLAVNREEAGRYGTDVAAVGAMVQLVTNGVLIGTYRPDDSRDEVDIRVRLPVDQRSIDRLDGMRIQTPNGLVPLSNFVTREVKPQVNDLTRKDGKLAVFVKANVAKGVLADAKVKELSQWLGEQQWPAGVHLKFRGADEEQQQSQQFLVKAMLAAIFLMFMILVTQFNSFYHALLTLSTLVMSVAGVLIGMLVTGQSFSVIMTGTGVVALAGIVVNNAIVLIDTYHVLLREGHPVRDAVLRTCAQRLRPVMLTTITTIFGLLPMIFEVNVDWIDRTVSVGSVTSAWWVQLATAICFGLAFATLLTLFLTPVLLAAPTVWRDTVIGYRDRWRRRRGKDDGPASGSSEGQGEDTARPGSPPFAEAAE